MSEHRHCGCLDRCLAENRSGVTSLLFAIMMVPLILILGIAIDFGFYIDASAKLNLAADAAAMHAVRAASMAASNGTTYSLAGTQAGYDWFAAQAGGVTEVSLNPSTPAPGTTQTVPVLVTVTYSAPTYTATVTYSGTINTIFGRIVGIRTWPIAGTATSTISNNYVDFAIMIDNSQSMLIGATPADISMMEENTPCAVVKTENGTTPGLDMRAYSYHLNGPTSASTYPPFPWSGTVGYASGVNTTLPTYTGYHGGPTNPAQEFCDPNLVGGCGSGAPGGGYPPGVIYGAGGMYYTTKAKATAAKPEGSCNNGGGAPGLAGQYTPQAPCAFACHQNPDGGDWYAEARALGVNLRLDVVQKAAQTLLQNMETYSKPPQTLLNVGIYLFNSSFQPAYPCSGDGCSTPFGDDLKAAADILTVCTGTQTSGCLLPPITPDNPNTDIPDVFAQAAAFLKGKAGDGSSQATALKNLFIITDGVSDWPALGKSQVVGPIDQLVQNPCQQLKDQGFTIYVLYTPYEPLETWTYSYWLQPAAGAYPANLTLQNYVTEPQQGSDSLVEAALRACATSPTGFYKATDQQDITTALNQMLATALNSAAQVTD